jgi:hypothetical protein
VVPVVEIILDSISKLDRVPLLGKELAGEETLPGGDCDTPFPAAFDLAMARAERSCRRSFFRALDELRETVLVVGLGLVACCPKLSFCFDLTDVDLVNGLWSSSSAKIISNLDSTPATACCRNEPTFHFDFDPCVFCAMVS